MIKIANSPEEINFNGEGIALVTVAGKQICIIRNGDNYYACSATCPHASGDLAKGYIDVLGNIVCPVHQYKFNLKNGRHTGGEPYFLKTYQVQNQKDGIFLII